MGYTKDLWTRADPAMGRRVRNQRWGKGKRCLACWTDPDGREKAKAFRIQADADRHWQAMETDKQRGDYHDPDAGKVLVSDIGKRWLASRVVDPATFLRYETAYRLHVIPALGHRQVRAVKPSRIQVWISELNERFEPSTVITAFLVLQGILDLAVADDAIKDNPAKSPVVRSPVHQSSEIQVWDDQTIAVLIDAHPHALRAIPELAASCGMREGELYGLALEDFDLDQKIVKVRRQVKKLGCTFVFALPKNDRERVIPLSDWAVDAVRRHIAKYPPRPYTLPWEKPAGKPHTCNILFRWHTDDQHIKARNYSETVWKPALVKAGVVPQPARDRRGRSRYVTTRKEGIHQLRHYYASVMLAGGVSIKELAEYLGHSDPAFTLRVYAHLLPSSHDRARAVINVRFASLTLTEQRRNRTGHDDSRRSQVAG
ncbi:MAG: site-specific integrase [Streptosporangiaceae bacterium]|nr:site-specific integrase [Streptosporangiaceae bacterium]